MGGLVSAARPTLDAEHIGAIILAVGLAILALWIVCYLAALPGKTARERGHLSAEAISICGWLGFLFFWPLWIVAIIWANSGPRRAVAAPRASRRVRFNSSASAASALQQMTTPEAPHEEDPTPMTYEEACRAAASEAAPMADGPGHYHICGVNRETGGDISTYIQADSRRNAQVKAQLKGIVVTSIDRI